MSGRVSHFAVNDEAAIFASGTFMDIFPGSPCCCSVSVLIMIMIMIRIA